MAIHIYSSNGDIYTLNCVFLAYTTFSYIYTLNDKAYVVPHAVSSAHPTPSLCAFALPCMSDFSCTVCSTITGATVEPVCTAVPELKRIMGTVRAIGRVPVSDTCLLNTEFHV
jgi:hypothetical protein